MDCLRVRTEDVWCTQTLLNLYGTQNNETGRLSTGWLQQGSQFSLATPFFENYIGVSSSDRRLIGGNCSEQKKNGKTTTQRRQWTSI
jgi:hypothetical protein